MLAGSYRLAPSTSRPASRSSRSAFSWPSSVRKTWCVFSSTVKSPGSITPSPVRRSSSPICFLRLGTTALMRTYMLGVVLGLAADDERRARLVDQDRVDLVDDRVGQAARDPVGDVLDHVVAQVVEAELVVRAVGHVGGVGGLLGLARHLRRVDADREAHEVVEPPHPLGVAPGQVVVDRDQVHALAGERVEVDRQGRHQRLALAGAHLGDLAVVERHAADQLDVEVAHLQGALARLAHRGEGLGQDRVERFAAGDALAELEGLVAQRLVAQGREAGLQGVDLLHDLPVLLEQPVVAAAEDRGEKLGQHACAGSRRGARPVTKQPRGAVPRGTRARRNCGRRPRMQGGCRARLRAQKGEF